MQHLFQKTHKSFVKLILNVAISIHDFEKSFALFQEYQNILFSCGIHPLCKNINDENNILALEQHIIHNKKIIALGETGLDFYHLPILKEIQKKSFIKHLQLGIKYNKPIIIHTRNSISEIINILSNIEYQSCQGIIHSFTGNIDEARKLLNLGFYISFSGIVTFRNAYEVKKTAQFVPIDRMFIETDSPYLSPEPCRGISNNPSNLLYIAKYISKIKNINILELSKIIKKNFHLLFQL